jgi:ribosomal protein S18 acetylase RimI-like enzyme
MEVIFRNYKIKDYAQCESLVNEAWGFDKNFKPQGLADIAKEIYTKGSEINSNFRRVVEKDGKVVGFIFGLNKKGKNPKGKLIFGLKTLWKLLQIKPIQPRTRKELLSAFQVHEENRSKLVGSSNSEIVLFVVSKQYKGRGLGKRLWYEFLSNCQESSVESIIVETNRDGASTFYELLGFKIVGDFESPVHRFASPNGQACMYEFTCKKKSNNSN